MKILMINSVCGIGSTGRMCTDLAVALEKQGHQVKIAYGRKTVPRQFEQYAVRIGNDISLITHILKARWSDRCGFGSKRETREFIKWIKDYNPDVIHLHNLHGYYVNLELLFDYLRTCEKKIIWTLHDCWSFTGHCAHFDYVGCEKWKFKCENCPQRTHYPKSYMVDCSKVNYKKKKELFTSISNLTIVTPSVWLANLVEKSYLAHNAIKVIRNGVDTSVFRPRVNNVREEYGLENKKIILGVAAIWDKRKGLDSFIELSKMVSEDYRIVLVGVSRSQIKKLPANIVGIESVDSVERLAELYTMADVFVNPTLEDTYPTTNLEAIACGTPVVTFDTGGSSESARMYGKVVQKNDIEGILNAVDNASEFEKNHIDVDYNKTVARYLLLYNDIFDTN